MKKRSISIFIILFCLFNFCIGTVKSQTSMDGVMMNNHQICSGFIYSNSSWTKYWEGNYKRTNDNIGKLASQSVMFMTNYGIKDNLNVMINIPYVSANASKGTLHGMKGFQDGSIDLKWKAITFTEKQNKFSIITDIGFSTPLSNYVIDFLPMSIGMGSTNFSGRVIADYQKGKFFSTVSANYTLRSNVKLDRTAYYTTSLHNTNEVKMPNTANFIISAGVRANNFIVEANASRMETLGGFDIRKNDMPFVSNEMNATMVGVSGKYFLPFNNHIELVASVSSLVGGRNVGQATSIEGGLFYVLSFKHKKK